MKMYNNNGEAVVLEDFIELEVKTNNTFELDIVGSWKQKYNMSDDTIVTWAAVNYNFSDTYNLIGGDDEDYDINGFDMFEYEVNSEDIIEESEDDNGRFLIILER